MVLEVNKDRPKREVVMSKCCKCGRESRDLDWGTLGNDTIVGYCPECTSNGYCSEEKWKVMPQFVERAKTDERMAKFMNRKVK